MGIQTTINATATGVRVADLADQYAQDSANGKAKQSMPIPPLPADEPIDEPREITKMIDEANKAAGQTKAQLGGIDDEVLNRVISKARRLVDLALADQGKGTELWHDPERKAYVSLKVKGKGDQKNKEHQEHHLIKSSYYRQLLAPLLWKTRKTTAAPAVYAEVFETLAGKAINEGEKHSVHLRAAEHQGNIYVDLCNESWQVVEIDSAGWRVIESADCPVRFRRTKGMLPLPTPTQNGDLADLRNCLNLTREDEGGSKGNDAAWILILAWLVNGFRAGRPFPVISLHGQQGSGKSSASRMLRRLIDPNVADLRATPKDERDLIIAANNGWVLAFDNLTTVSEALSNALCRISTGGGFSTRTLHENDEETIFNVKRPMLLNGITEIVTKSDLLDRCILIYLPTIPKESRKTEEEIDAEFERIWPDTLGAIFTAVSCGLRRLPHISVPYLPRMADFARFATAAEPGMGLQSGEFMRAYSSNIAGANDLALEHSIVASVFMAMLENQNEWEGTAASLLKAMESHLSANGEDPKKKLGWPKSPRGLSDHLKKCAPNLRERGFVLEFTRNKTARVIRVTKVKNIATDDELKPIGHAAQSDNIANKKTGDFSVISVTSVTSDPNSHLNSESKRVTGLPLGDAEGDAEMTDDAERFSASPSASPAKCSKQKTYGLDDADDAGDAEIPHFQNAYTSEFIGSESEGVEVVI